MSTVHVVCESGVRGSYVHSVWTTRQAAAKAVDDLVVADPRHDSDLRYFVVERELLE